MKKIYDDAKDKNVASCVLYGDTTDHKLYHEATGASKTQVTQAELTDLFDKMRVIIESNDKKFIPVKLDGATVTTIDVSSNTVIKVDWTAMTASNVGV